MQDFLLVPQRIVIDSLRRFLYASSHQAIGKGLGMRTFFVYSLIFSFVIAPTTYAQRGGGGGVQAPPDVKRAAGLGKRDGRRAGRREATDRLAEMERRQHRMASQRAFDATRAIEARVAFDAGAAKGFAAGRTQGLDQGEAEGIRVGNKMGLDEGFKEGDNAADEQGRKDGNAQGTPLGRQQADASDATQQGKTEGERLGDQQAQERARKIDYQEARKAYRAARWAEKIDSKDSFSQRPGKKTKTSFFFLPEKRTLDNVQLASFKQHPRPDWRYLVEKKPRVFAYPVERQTYLQTREMAYERAFNEIMLERVAGGLRRYEAVMAAAQAAGEQHGAARARALDYTQDHDAGYNEGRAKGITDGFDENFSKYRDKVRRRVRAEESDRVYRQQYPIYATRYKEQYRAAAYNARYSELYQAALEPARKSTFDDRYTNTYKPQQIANGERDETAEFARRPVRLLNVEAVETIANGVYEPGETIRLRVKLRNFSDQAIAGKEIALRVQALNPNHSAVAVGQETLVKDLNRKSETEINDALEIALMDTAIGQATGFKVSVLYKGAEMQSTQLNLRANYQIDTQLAERPTFQQGLPTSIKVRVTNRSQVATTNDFKVTLSTDPRLVEVIRNVVKVGILEKAGSQNSSRIVEFIVKGKASGNSVQVPLAVESADAGRRIGLYSKNERIPILNDYRIALKTSAQGLTGAGVVRIYYVLKNANSRLTHKFLQLHVRVKDSKGKVDKNFVVLGPQPQLLRPLHNGEKTEFVIPILSKGANSGGIVELEVREDGRVVVIHEVGF